MDVDSQSGAEYQMDRGNDNFSFARSLRRILRRLPQVLFIVESPSPQQTPVFNDMESSGVDLAVLYLRHESMGHGWGRLSLNHPHCFMNWERRSAFRLARALCTSDTARVVAPFGYRGSVRMGALLAARVRGLQVLTRSDSNPVRLEGESALKRQIRALGMRLAFPPSTRVWVMGSGNQTFWEDYLRRPNTILIPYSAPSLPSSTGRKPEPRASDPDSLRFLFVGRLVPVKDVETLIRAFQRVRGPAERHWVLDVVGDGDLMPELQAAATGDARITFHGAVEHDSLDTFYLNADVLVLPSKEEAWGLVVNEAMGFGLWVIVSDQVGAKELITNNSLGKVFAVRDQSQLVEALREARQHLNRCPVVPFNPAKMMIGDLQALMSKSKV